MARTARLYFKQLLRKPALLLAVLAAILYCSWPLGYVLNPFVGSHDLASQLEAPHQPYNWLFIIMDVMAGLAVTVVATMQINRNAHTVIKWCIVSYGIFGILVSMAALTPLNCNVTTDTCGPILRNPQLIIHGAASVLSVGFLFLSTLTLGASVFRHKYAIARWAFGFVITAWIFFGFGSLVELRYHDTGNGLQEFFITICSISILLVISVIEYRYVSERQVATVKQQID